MGSRSLLSLVNCVVTAFTAFCIARSTVTEALRLIHCGPAALYLRPTPSERERVNFARRRLRLRDSGVLVD